MAKGSRQQKKKCVKPTAFPCKFTCLPRRQPSGKLTNCRNPLKGQAATAVLWVADQERRLAEVNQKRANKGRGTLSVIDGRLVKSSVSRLSDRPVAKNAIAASPERIAMQKVNKQADSLIEKIDKGESRFGKMIKDLGELDKDRQLTPDDILRQKQYADEIASRPKGKGGIKKILQDIEDAESRELEHERLRLQKQQLEQSVKGKAIAVNNPDKKLIAILEKKPHEMTEDEFKFAKQDILRKLSSIPLNSSEMVRQQDKIAKETREKLKQLGIETYKGSQYSSQGGTYSHAGLGVYYHYNIPPKVRDQANKVIDDTKAKIKKLDSDKRKQIDALGLPPIAFEIAMPGKTHSSYVFESKKEKAIADTKPNQLTDPLASLSEKELDERTSKMSDEEYLGSDEWRSHQIRHIQRGNQVLKRLVNELAANQGKPRKVKEIQEQINRQKANVDQLKASLTESGTKKIVEDNAQKQQSKADYRRELFGLTSKPPSVDPKTAISVRSVPLAESRLLQVMPTSDKSTPEGRVISGKAIYPRIKTAIAKSGTATVPEFFRDVETPLKSLEQKGWIVKAPIEWDGKGIYDLSAIAVGGYGADAGTASWGGSKLPKAKQGDPQGYHYLLTDAGMQAVANIELRPQIAELRQKGISDDLIDDVITFGMDELKRQFTKAQKLYKESYGDKAKELRSTAAASTLTRLEPLFGRPKVYDEIAARRKPVVKNAIADSTTKKITDTQPPKDKFDNEENPSWFREDGGINYNKVSQFALENSKYGKAFTQIEDALKKTGDRQNLSKFWQQVRFRFDEGLPLLDDNDFSIGKFKGTGLTKALGKKIMAIKDDYHPLIEKSVAELKSVTDKQFKKAIADSKPSPSGIGDRVSGRGESNMKSVGEFHVKSENFASTRPKWESVIKELEKKETGDALYVSRSGQGFYVYKSGGQYSITTIKDKKAVNRSFVPSKEFEQNYRWYV